jgi:RimJ/RimL family protein N-acetyltransferase
MFARTPRLTLRPAWPEDAAALAVAIGHEEVARTLGGVPFPYSLADAHEWVGEPRTAHEPRFLIFAHDERQPRLIGGIAIAASTGGAALATLGYWLTPAAWGRGYATEAGQAVVAMARHALPIDRLGAWHFADNPASGRVLRKLGFEPTGNTIAKAAAGRQAMAPCTEYELDLSVAAAMPIAA